MYGIAAAPCPFIMKAAVGMVLTLLVHPLAGQPDPDTTHVATVGATVLVGTSGFAPVPAFSFDSPVATANLTLCKGRMCYEPDISVGLNGKPWMASHWFRFRALRGKRVDASVGVNPSFFFLHHKPDSGRATIEALRNLTLETRVGWAASTRTRVVITWMQINAFDAGGLSGSVVDLTSVIAAPWGRFVQMEFKPSLFYFDFDDNTDGFYGASTISATFVKVHIGFQLQAVAPVWTSFEGSRFKWNAAFVFHFLTAHE